MNCWEGHGARDLEPPGESMTYSNATLEAAKRFSGKAKSDLLRKACETGCLHTDGCDGYILVDDKCFRKADFNLPRCVHDFNLEIWMWTFTSPPLPPYPPHPPPSPPISEQNTVKFFAIGDWNFDHSGESEPNYLPGWVHNRVVCTSTCQGYIADKMREEAAKWPEMYKFVINAGDNFYPFGVDTEFSWEWDGRWGQVYDGLPQMVWYSTQGNHDISQVNRECACGRSKEGCSQIRKHYSGQPTHRGQTWYMPDFNYWVKPLGDAVPLEIISLDTNHHDSGRICPWNVCDRHSCGGWENPYGCTVGDCMGILEDRNFEAERMLRERLDANIGGNVIVFTHYPQEYLLWGGVLGEHGSPGILDQLKRTDVTITFFSAHVHVTEGPKELGPNVEWVVGGGGGWSCDGEQGVVTGDVEVATGKVRNVRMIPAPWHVCCRDNPHPGG